MGVDMGASGKNRWPVGEMGDISGWFRNHSESSGGSATPDVHATGGPMSQSDVAPGDD
jgi:hypothetical protein